MLASFSSRAITRGALAVAVASTYYAFKTIVSYSKARQTEKERANRLIIITGCDTGLGYSAAVWACKLGYRVVAACLHENGEGAQKLKRQFRDQVIVAGLDVTDMTSMKNFHALCKDILETSQGKLHLWAVLSNAAVCTMGEFFWQTQRQWEQQMEVNFWGTVRLISELRTLLFEYKARVIVVSSDCSEYPLPFLSAYCASKAALNVWAQSFRFEVAKYGIHVAIYHPRGFSQKSGLFSNLKPQYDQMVAGMTNFERNLYGEYFDNFMKRKQEIFSSVETMPVKPLNTYHHRRSIIYLLENDIRGISVYRDFSWMENIFHGLYRALPQRMVDGMVVKLLNPDFNTVYWKEQDAPTSSV